MILTIYITGFIVCLIYDLTLIAGGLKIKQGKLIVEIFESLLWFITLPLSLIVSLFLKSKGRQVFKHEKT